MTLLSWLTARDSVVAAEYTTSKNIGEMCYFLNCKKIYDSCLCMHAQSGLHSNDLCVSFISFEWFWKKVTALVCALWKGDHRRISCIKRSVTFSPARSALVRITARFWYTLQVFILVDTHAHTQTHTQSCTHARTKNCCGPLMLNCESVLEWRTLNVFSYEIPLHLVYSALIYKVCPCL